MKYIHYFETNSEFESAYTENYIEPWVSYTEENGKVNYNKELKPDYRSMPLTFVARENGTFKFSGSTTANTLSYSLDNGTTWTVLAHNTDTPTVTAGSSIMWKGTPTIAEYDGIGTFISSGKFDIEGNVMSLLYGDNFIGQIDLTGKDYAFYYLFGENTNVVNTQNISLPATTLADWCYAYMFDGCTSLTKAPELPATTLANWCYEYVFRYCTSLTTAPQLPATTLAEGCYDGMFYGCTSLTTAPELPATTLAEYCYNGMFYNCSSLITAPELPATTLASNCYASMFQGTSLTTAPELPATTLASECYLHMFWDCTNLNYIKCLATNISASNCIDGWVNGVASSGTFVKNANMSSWTTGISGIPSNWTIEDA